MTIQKYDCSTHTIYIRYTYDIVYIIAHLVNTLFALKNNVMIHGIQGGWVGLQQRKVMGDNSGRIREGFNSSILDRGGHPHGQVYHREEYE